MNFRLKILSLIGAGLALAIAGVHPIHAADQGVAGLWEQTDDDGQPGGWFFFFERDGLYQGAIVKMFSKPGEPLIQTCTKCTDERKNAPMLGLSIIKGMQRKGRVYENGTILDPRDGTVYKAKLEVSPDSQKLNVRGFLGIELLGRSQVWKRLPDTAMMEDELPENLRPYAVTAQKLPPAPPPAHVKPQQRAQPGKQQQQQPAQQPQLRR